MGRTFQESFQKALRGLEVGAYGLDEVEADEEDLERELASPGAQRIWYVGQAFREGMSFDKVHQLTRIDPWFLAQIEDIVLTEKSLAGRSLKGMAATELRELKKKGFSDRRLSKLLNIDETAVRLHRHTLGVRPVFKRVDTCAAEFATSTAYLYSSYEEECEARPTDKKKIMVLGAAPTASARASSSTIAASMRPWPCARTASRPSWSIATRRPCPPTTTPPTACTSSPSPWRTSWRSSP